MRITLTSILLLLNSFLFAQSTLKTVVEGDSKFFDYEDYAGPNQPIGDKIFLKGCSWYCAGKVHEIYASSELKPSGTNTYSASNAHDFKETTAWVEGKEDYGIGESITYVFDYTNEPELAARLGVNQLLIANGYKKSKSLWEANSRVKKLRMYVNGEPFADIELADEFEIQTVEFEPILFRTGRKELKFEILEVYPGTKYKDTAISLLMFEGVGDH
ncbi:MULTISPECIES: NADase-type glycan-binding domain-containing protein [Cytophagales]|uniref:NADase-type glycan-binding domain-containing protein n=1 Tax=Cytophagales TaxID=768507 RepID=UPI0032F06533